MRTGDGRLVTFGESMGLFAASQNGRFGVDRSFAFGIGGAESNVAIGAARLGATVTWFGRVGNDATGELIARLIAAEVDEAMVIRDPGFTGLMVKHERFTDVSHVDYHRCGSAGSRLNVDDIPIERVRSAEIVHVSGITPALSLSARAAVFESVELAHDAGVRVSFDVNYRRKLWSPDEAAPVLRDLARRSDIVFAGREEADLVSGETTPAAADAAATLASLGVAEAVIKDGERGCSAVVDGAEHHVPARPVRVVDAVGAGDAFVAGYLAERLAGAHPAARLATATAAGALAVSAPGDCENLPFRSDLIRIGDDVAR